MANNCSVKSYDNTIIVFVEYEENCKRDKLLTTQSTFQCTRTEFMEPIVYYHIAPTSKTLILMF